MKLNEKNLAVKMRRRGASYGDIRAKISVSKGTLSTWLKDIELSPTQIKTLLKGREVSRYAAGEKRKTERKIKTKKLVELAKKEFVEMIKSPLFLIGLSLYWAEGDKHKQERVKFTNSDAVLIAIMMRWFREICHVPENKFRIALHIHNIHVTKDVKTYWSALTGIPINQFQKVYIKPSSLKYRRNILYNGTCAIVVHNKDLFRRITGWKEALAERFATLPS